MNENEIDRIAAMANALRPDWPASSIRALLNRPELVTKARRDVAVALAWVACESSTKTPARVIEAGPWWKAANAEGTVAQLPPKREEACQTCGRREGEHVGVYGDHDFRPLAPMRYAVGDVRNSFENAPSRPPTAASHFLTTARAELARVQQNTCSHGVDRTRAKCHDCTETTTSTTTEESA